jgi:hypothetical protein
VSSKLVGLLVVTGLSLGIASTVAASRVVSRENSRTADCTWGASSILVENGKVVAGPDVTGCIP